MRRLFRLLQWLRFLLVFPFLSVDEKLQKDIARWCRILNLKESGVSAMRMLLWTHKEFRNLVAYRNRQSVLGRRWFCIVYPLMDSLYLEAKEIGGGLFIQHGFATMIAAESIGENCWINQQVTIGYRDNTRCPRIGNGVMITCGAKVLGDIDVGDRAIIGANAVVIRNVRAGATVVGVPAHEIRKSKDEQEVCR